MENVIYRKLERKDVNQVIELRKQQLHEEGTEATIELTKPLSDFYNKHLNDDAFIFWLAIDNDTIIATSGMSIVEKPPYYSNPTGRIGLLSSMFTLKPYRRKGIAKNLLESVVNEARECGCGYIFGRIHSIIEESGIWRLL